MAKRIFAANSLTGGVSGCLDDIKDSSIENGNIAIVVDVSANKTYFYKYNSSETGAESSPDIIVPDSNITGTGAWVITDVYTTELTGLVDLSISGDLTVGGTADVTGAATAASLQLGGAGATPTEFSTDETLVDNSDTAIPTEQAVKQYVDQYSPDKNNLLINGNFDIWQRGTSGFATTGYTADRWRASLTGVTGAISRGAFSAAGSESFVSRPTYFMNYAISGSASAGDYALIGQRIEDVKTAADKTVTVSFWARSTAGTSSLTIEAVQNFGSGGSTAVTEIAVEKVALTGDFAQYEVTFDVPSISGKTIGTSSFIELIFWLSAGTDFDSRTDSLGHQNDTFALAEVKLEEGSVATPFVPRPIAEELALCHRYYWTGYAGNRGRGWNYINASGSANTGAEVSLPVNMRALPTCSILVAPTYVNCSSGSFVATDDGFGHMLSTTGAARYRAYDGKYDADAEL